jgi:hypothetical protein
MWSDVHVQLGFIIGRQMPLALASACAATRSDGSRSALASGREAE